jgi:hypothetical protein
VSDERIKKSPGEDKSSRAMEDRSVTENRELTDRERAEFFRASFNQTSLPNLPIKPGYHLCWLTTTNPNDSITNRKRMGYELLHSDELPGYESNFIKTGEFAGFIGVNEMVAAQIPMDLYQLYMKIAHSEMPAEEEVRMNSAAETIKEEAAKRGLKVREGADADDWA